jgi:glycosyltransferase involved in cell wall biosynthesis
MLMVDADEELVATPDEIASLRESLLSLRPDHVVCLRTSNVIDSFAGRVASGYFMRRVVHRSLQYQLRIHEKAVLADGADPQMVEMEGPWFSHYGYTDGLDARAERNVRIAEKRLAEATDPEERDRAELERGRALALQGRLDEARDVLRGLALEAASGLVMVDARHMLVLLGLVDADEARRLLVSIVTAGNGLEALSESVAATKYLLATISPPAETLSLLEGVVESRYGLVWVSADGVRSVRLWALVSLGDSEGAFAVAAEMNQPFLQPHCWWSACLFAAQGDTVLAQWLVERLPDDQLNAAVEALAAGPGVGMIDVVSVLWGRFGSVPALVVLLAGPVARGGFFAAFRARLLLAEAGALGAGDPLEHLLASDHGDVADRLLAAVVLDELDPVGVSRVDAVLPEVKPDQVGAVLDAVRGVVPGRVPDLEVALGVGSRPETAMEPAPTAGSVWGHDHEVPLLTAVMIVKNEAGRVERAIASVAGLVDEVVVYDTGSTDDTVELARAAGAVVQLGYWDDDFSRARNESIAMARSEWVMVLDADEELVATPDEIAEVRSMLAALDPDQMVKVGARNVVDEFAGALSAPFSIRRIMHRTSRYQRRVHELPLCADGSDPRDIELDGLWFRHSGYAGDQTEKRVRNARIANQRLVEAATDGERDLAELERARALWANGDHEQFRVTVRQLIDTSAFPEVVAVARILLATVVGPHEGATMVHETVAPLLGTSPAADTAARYLMATTASPAEAVALLDGVVDVAFGYLFASADQVASLRVYALQASGDAAGAVDVVAAMDDPCGQARCWWAACNQAAAGDTGLATRLAGRLSADQLNSAAASLARGPGAGLVEVVDVLRVHVGLQPILVTLLAGPAARGGFFAAFRARFVLAEAGALDAGDPLEQLLSAGYGDAADRLLAALVLDEIEPVDVPRVDAVLPEVEPEQIDGVLQAVAGVLPGRVDELRARLRSNAVEADGTADVRPRPRPVVALIGPKDIRKEARRRLRGIDLVEYPVWSGLPAGPAVCVDARRLDYLSPGAIASLWAGLDSGAALVVPASNIGAWPLCGLDSPRGGATVAELDEHAERIRDRGVDELADAASPLPAVFAVADAAQLTRSPRTVGDVAVTAPIMASVWCHHRATVLLSATMIVKNEAHNIEAAIRSLDGFADEVVIYDTGSTDDTVAIARRLGASVRVGHWDDDFARARNEACAMMRGEWFLFHDGDDRLTGDARARVRLREVLPTINDNTAVLLELHNLLDAATGETAPYFWTKRIFPRQMRWRHRIHEMAVLPDGSLPDEVRVADFPVLHVGYAGGMGERLDRNLRLAEMRCAEAEPGEQHLAEFEMARSLMAMGRTQEASVRFGTVIDLAPDSVEGLCSRMFAARLVGVLGFAEFGLEIIEPLLDCEGVEARQAARYVASGLTPDPEQRRELLDGIDEVNWMYIRATADEVEARRQGDALPTDPWFVVPATDPESQSRPTVSVTPSP